MAALHPQNPPSLNLALIVVPNDVQGGLRKVQDKLEEGLTVKTVDVSVDLQTGHSSAALVAVATHPDTMFETTNLSANMQTTHVAVATDEDATMTSNIVAATDEEARIPFAELLAWWRQKIEGKPAPGRHFVSRTVNWSRVMQYSSKYFARLCERPRAWGKIQGVFPSTTFQRKSTLVPAHHPPKVTRGFGSRGLLTMNCLFYSWIHYLVLEGATGKWKPPSRISFIPVTVLRIRLRTEDEMEALRVFTPQKKMKRFFRGSDPTLCIYPGKDAHTILAGHCAISLPNPSPPPTALVYAIVLRHRRLYAKSALALACSAGELSVPSSHEYPHRAQSQPLVRALYIATSVVRRRRRAVHDESCDQRRRGRWGEFESLDFGPAGGGGGGRDSSDGIDVKLNFDLTENARAVGTACETRDTVVERFFDSGFQPFGRAAERDAAVLPPLRFLSLSARRPPSKQSSQGSSGKPIRMERAGGVSGATVDLAQECSWALVEYKPRTSAQQDPSSTVVLFEEFVPPEYRLALAGSAPPPGTCRRLPALFSPSPVPAMGGKTWKQASTLNGRPHVLGPTPIITSNTQRLDFESMLKAQRDEAHDAE
ncbi:hypothetical protein C8R45DRAFT_1163313 [Mycena sanguinolenta]|nr:hypothetical protein C8R45DRAFT_1163313 [Mycena sanguinolenta]